MLSHCQPDRLFSFNIDYSDDNLYKIMHHAYIFSQERILAVASATPAQVVFWQSSGFV